MMKPTIYQVLMEKLGRVPTNAELRAEVKRIKVEALVELAKKGGTSHHNRCSQLGKIKFRE